MFCYSVEVIFNNEQLYGNLQNHHPGCIMYDLENPVYWSPFIPEYNFYFTHTKHIEMHLFHSFLCWFLNFVWLWLVLTFDWIWFRNMANEIRPIDGAVTLGKAVSPASCEMLAHKLSSEVINLLLTDIQPRQLQFCIFVFKILNVL